MKGAICDYTEDYDERDELPEELNERLEERGDLGLEQPIGTVVESICRAKRLPFDFALWENEPWAISEAENKTEGSPYAGWRPSTNDRAGDYGGGSDAQYRRGIGPP